MTFCYKVYVDGSWFLIFGLPLYALKHLIRYKMGSNLIYFIHLIHYSTYCYKHLYYQKQILQEQSNLIIISAIRIGFRRLLLVFGRRDTF